MFKPGLIKDIPKKMQAQRESNKPTTEEMLAILSAIIEGHEQINDDFGTSEKASKKAEAINRWMMKMPAIPSTLTAFVRGTEVYIADTRNLVVGNE